MDINFDNIEDRKKLLKGLDTVLKCDDILNCSFYEDLKKTKDSLEADIENYEKEQKNNISPRIKEGSAFLIVWGKKNIEYFKIDKVDLEKNHIWITCIYIKSDYYQVVKSDHDIEIYNRIIKKYEPSDITEEKWISVYSVADKIKEFIE